MTEKAGYHIGSGIAWAGFWIMLGMIISSSVPNKLNNWAMEEATVVKELPRSPEPIK